MNFIFIVESFNLFEYNTGFIFSLLTLYPKIGQEQLRYCKIKEIHLFLNHLLDLRT